MTMRHLFADSIGAHAMRFEKPLAPTYGDDAGVRMLAAFLVVGIAMPFALRFAFDMAGVRGMPGAGLGFVVAWLAAFVIAHRYLVRLPMAAVGLRPWVGWTRRERLYLLQVAPLAVVVFAVVFRAHLQALLDRHGIAGFLWFSVFGGLAWGFAQELVYRGWLQTELTRRFGTVAGAIAANVVFTFGPLHFDHFGGADGVRWGSLAAVFAIGLFFGIVYARSGNVWIPATMHGLWPPNMS
jgi:membrane protease YdiL (CAAX protease family)